MVLQAVFEDEPFHVVRYSGVLQFDVQQESPAESIENVCQKRDALSETGIELPQLLVREIGNAALAVGGPVDGFVMDHDDPAVGATANVELDAVGAVLQSFLEGPDCVFRFAWISWRSAMSKDPHTISVLRAWVDITFP